MGDTDKGEGKNLKKWMTSLMHGLSNKLIQIHENFEIFIYFNFRLQDHGCRRRNKISKQKCEI